MSSLFCFRLDIGGADADETSVPINEGDSTSPRVHDSPADVQSVSSGHPPICPAPIRTPINTKSRTATQSSRTQVTSPQSTPKRTPRSAMVPKVQIQPQSPVSRISSAGILATPRVVRSARFKRSDITETQTSGLLSIPSRRNIRNSGSDSMSSGYYPSSRSTSHSPTSPDTSYITQWSSDSSSQLSPERLSSDSGTSSTQRPLAIDSRRAHTTRRNSQEDSSHYGTASYGASQCNTRTDGTRQYGVREDRSHHGTVPHATTQYTTGAGGASHLPQWQSERWRHWEIITKQQSEESQEQQTLVWNQLNVPLCVHTATDTLVICRSHTFIFYTELERVV